MICKDFPTAAIIKTKNLQKLQFVKKKSHHFQSFQHFFYIHIRFYQKDKTKESKKKNICIITFDLSIIQTDSCIFQLIHHSTSSVCGKKIALILHIFQSILKQALNFAVFVSYLNMNCTDVLIKSVWFTKSKTLQVSKSYLLYV